MKILKISIDDIIIPPYFVTPNVTKYETKLNRFNQTHEQTELIVVRKHNDKYMLIDGYIMFLILKENNITMCDVVCKKYDYYCFGRHVNQSTDKEYVWKIGRLKAHQVNPGDIVMAETVKGKLPIIVSRIEYLDYVPVDKKIRKIL